MNTKEAGDTKQDFTASEMQQQNVVDVALAKLLSGVSGSKGVEFWKEPLNLHYNRPRHNPIACVLQNKEAIDSSKSLRIPELEKMLKNAIYNSVFLWCCFTFLTGSVAYLSYYDKLVTSTGVILGYLAVYILGRAECWLMNIKRTLPERKNYKRRSKQNKRLYPMTVRFLPFTLSPPLNSLT